ncbi:MAG: carboxylating nicotinate-nucleotide diphosphorylase [Acidimicrobiia bacterium]
MTDLDPPMIVVRDVVERALEEDLGALGDLTSIAVVPENAPGTGRFVARAGGVIAGTAAATETFAQVDPTVCVTWSVTDGATVDDGAELGRVEGLARSLLVAERTALNLLTHCSGVASLTRRFVDAVAGTSARIRDTRKTLPGLRALEKAAVRAGGGFNHRESLSDAVLIKDNHLAHLPVRDAVEQARARWPGRVVEVECDSLDQVAEAKAVGPDLVLLDNMTPAEVTEAVAVLGGALPVEVSGGVTLETVRAYAEAGADFVSVGAITHSAPVLDIALDLL